MDNRRIRIIYLTAILACFSFMLSYAQPVVKTSVDKNEILIGEQLKLRIEAGFLPEEYKINWPVIPDSLPHFEVLNRSGIDSIYNNNRLTGLVQTLTLISFDSGKWALPSFLISINPVKDDTTYQFFTDSGPVTVSFSAADSTNMIRDIKPIREVEALNPLWYWIGAAVLLLALVIFLIWFYRYWKNNKTTVPFQTKNSPYDEAMKDLEKLKAHDLTLPVEIKIVHTRLGEILKRFLSRTQKNDYRNKTTGDILISLRDHYLDKNMLAKAAASLRCGDAVKFAKYLPPVNESNECLQWTKDVIEAIQQALPAKPLAISNRQLAISNEQQTISNTQQAIRNK